MEISKSLANDFSGPIIFSYVWWVLWEAEKRGIKRLYFLARDGYTLLRAARSFCDRFHLDIECRYLYCSRAALRMPTYFFLGDEAYDLLFRWGYCVSLKLVLVRADLTPEERKAVYKDCGIENADEDKLLSKREFGEYALLLRTSHTLRRLIVEKSKAAYPAAVGYLRQEGLFDQELAAIVDSGWTGSIQRSMRQLMEFAGFGGKLIGFYFGMFECPKALADGEYLTWYFNAEKRSRDKAIFNNNLFECLLAAPHGMTRGYQKRVNTYVPVFAQQPSDKERERIEEQSAAICDYCSTRIREITFSAFDASGMHRDTAQRIKRYMFEPREKEAAYYGQFLFCDDMTESYWTKLASVEQIAGLKDYLIPQRARKKLVKKASVEASKDLFWPCGTAAFLPEPQRLWYRLNIVLWELVKHLVHRERAQNEHDTITEERTAEKKQCISDICQSRQSKDAP